MDAFAKSTESEPVKPKAKTTAVRAQRLSRAASLALWPALPLRTTACALGAAQPCSCFCSCSPAAAAPHKQLSPPSALGAPQPKKTATKRKAASKKKQVEEEEEEDLEEVSEPYGCC